MSREVPFRVHGIEQRNLIACILLLVRSERLRKKIYNLNAPLLAAMAFSDTGRRELLPVAKFIA